MADDEAAELIGLDQSAKEWDNLLLLQLCYVKYYILDVS